MSKKTTNQFLLNSVRKLDKINNVELELQGNLNQILENPIEWAEAQVDNAIKSNIDKYLESKALGEEFYDEIRSRS